MKPSALPHTLLTVSGIKRSIVTETATPPAIVESEFPLTNVSAGGDVNWFVFAGS